MRQAFIHTKYVYIVLVFYFVLSAADAQAGFVVTEGTAEPPHRKVGEVEVSVKAPGPSLIGWVKGADRAGRIKGKLHRKLKKAAKKYHVDAITEVKYFPDPKEPSHFRSQEYYARGTLIAFTKFEATKVATKKG